MARLNKSKERTEREKLRQTEREERKVNKIQGECGSWTDEPKRSSSAGCQRPEREPAAAAGAF